MSAQPPLSTELLRPCPFCFDTRGLIVGSNHRGIQVQCSHCGGSGPAIHPKDVPETREGGDAYDAARSAWNVRLVSW